MWIYIVLMMAAVELSMPWWVFAVIFFGTFCGFLTMFSSKKRD